jgi:hypothetical protein
VNAARVGFYVIGVAVAQVGLTLAAVLDDSLTIPTLGFNPRFFWVTLFMSIGDRAGHVASIVAALVSMALGAALVRRRSSGALFVYLCAEGAFSIPALFLFVIFAVMDLSPSHGLSMTRADAAVPFAVFSTTILAPWLAALWLYRKLAN